MPRLLNAVGQAHLTALSAPAVLALGMSLTLAGGLAAAYWRERETIALLRGRTKEPKKGERDNEKAPQEQEALQTSQR